MTSLNAIKSVYIVKFLLIPKLYERKFLRLLKWVFAVTELKQ